MEDKPIQALLIDYLYDELEEDDRLRVEELIRSRQEVKVAWEKLQASKTMLNRYDEEEVQAPASLYSSFDSPSENAAGVSRKALWYPWAAAILLLVLFSGLLWTQGFHIQVANSGIYLGFGEAKARKSLQADEIEQLIQQSLYDYDQKQQKQVAEIREGLKNERQDIKELIKDSKTEQVRYINQQISNWQKENLQLLQAYADKQDLDQQPYMEALISEFASYMETQRKSDMKYIHDRLTLMELEKDLFKLETEDFIQRVFVSQERMDENY